MRVREHLSYRTFVLDLFLRLHFMSDETADAIATILSRLSGDAECKTSARTNSQYRQRQLFHVANSSLSRRPNFA